MRSWVSKLTLRRTPPAPECAPDDGSKDARIQARRQELLIAYGRLRGAVQALAVQKANALALTNEIRAEFGAKAARQLFLEVGFPLRTSPEKWMRTIYDQILTHIGTLPPGAFNAVDQSNKEMALTGTGAKSSTCRTTARKPNNPDLLTSEQVCALFGGITRSGLYQGIKDNRFPKPIKIGPKTARWLRSECNDVLRRRAQERT